MSKNEFIFVLIITAIVTFIWLTSDILKASPTYTISSQVESLEQPFDASFPQDTLKQVKALSTQSTASPSSTVVPLPTPISPSALGVSTSSAKKK